MVAASPGPAAPASGASGATGAVPVVELRDVWKTYGEGETAVHALRGVSLSVDRGDYVAVMGASGSGKSTLMHVVGCLDVPTAGDYRLEGHDVAGLNEGQLALLRNRRIGFVFQSFNLLPRLTAVGNVELPLVYAGAPRPDRRRMAMETLAGLGVADRAHHLPSALSGGQEQRVAIARALVTAPALLLADEPTGNLDSQATAEMLRIFDRLNGGGVTFIVVTHEDHVAAHAKRVVRIADGRVVDDDRVAAVEDPPPALLQQEAAS